jgi:hypothetical protein
LGSVILKYLEISKVRWKLAGLRTVTVRGRLILAKLWKRVAIFFVTGLDKSLLKA